MKPKMTILFIGKNQGRQNTNFFPQAEKGLSINSSGKMIKNIKKVIRDCVDKDWLDKDPFWRYRLNILIQRFPTFPPLS